MQTNETEKDQLGRIEAQFKALGKKLDALVAGFEGVGAQVKGDYAKRLEDLRAKRAAAEAKLDELRSTSGEKWQVLKGGFNRAWNDLEAAFKALSQAKEKQRSTPDEPTPPTT